MSWKNAFSDTCADWQFDTDGKGLYLNHWWEVFDDETLNELECAALENNNNLFVAFQRVLEAKDLMKIAAADFYPQLTLNPQYTNTGELIELYGAASTPASDLAAAGITKFIRAHELFFFMPLNLSYEVDLWGKIRDAYAAAKYHYLGMEKDYEFVMLTLTSNLATAYYQLRAADSELGLLKDTIATRQKAFDINQSRYEEAVTFYGDVTLAGQQLTSVMAEYEDVLRLRNLLENQIAVLIGAMPSEFCLETAPLSGLPPCIPDGIPSEVLTRRPDIAEAEFNLRSQHALVKKACSEFYPSLSLTSAGGFESPVLKYFLQHFSRYWMLGANYNQMIFDGGRLGANLQRQIAIFKQVSGSYQQTILTAFQEVEDSLGNIEYSKQQYDTTAITVDWAKRSYELYKDRYEFGLVYYIDVANTERDLLATQIDLNQLLGFRYVNTIQLIKSLGGGWSFNSVECLDP